MCGIVACVGKENASEFVISGLKRLEYRGYDSFGYALNDNGKLVLEKKTGKISSYKFSPKKSGIAIGHTRWATHGKVSITNAHPHLSNNGEIAVVHNGIIENFFELRNFLKSKGIKFYSETDTEVIPNLIQHYMKQKNSFQEASRLASKQIEGFYAFMAMHIKSNSIVLSRYGSPLVIGIGKNTVFAASDANAFIHKTRNAVYLEDGELAVLDGGYKVLKTATGKIVSPTVTTINWSLEQARKGKHKHFMEKEIFEQPETIKAAAAQQPELLENAASILGKASKIILIGCGTSFHACIAGASMLSKATGKVCIPRLASEIDGLLGIIDAGTAVISVSQSGETADVIEAVKKIQEKKAKLISLTNVRGSSLSRLSDLDLPMNCGPEICVLSTKSYTSQLALLLLIASQIEGRQKNAKHLLEKTAHDAKKVIEKNSKLAERLAIEMSRKGHMFLIGKGMQHTTAMEGALKIKEVSYIHAEGFPGAELKHGTIALIEKGVPVIVCSDDSTRSQIINNALEIKLRGGTIIGIDSKNSPAFDHWFEVPEIGEAQPMLSILPIQLFAYHLAVERDLDPDMPRNLAKSVTVK